MDSKIYTLVIVGRVLQAAAVVGTLFSLAASLIVGPIALVVLMPSLGAFLLGHAMMQNNSPQSSIPPSIPVISGLIPNAFVPGQPVGLINSSNNCWINASMQCIIHIPALRQSACKVPELASFITHYLQVQNTAQNSTSLPWHDLNNFIISQLQNRQRSEFSFSGQADATTLFEWLLHQHPLYEFTRTRILNGYVVEINTIADLIRLELHPLIDETVPELLNHFMDHFISDGSHVKWQFNAAPETLAVLLERYNFLPNLVDRNRAAQSIHIRRPIQGVDNLLTLPSTSVMTLETANYACEAFIIHYGSFEGGHYVAYVKKEGFWWCCNDANVYKVSEQEARERMKESYLFFSNRINN